MRQGEEARLTHKFLAPVARSLGVSEEEQVGCGHEGGVRGGCTDFWLSMDTSGEDIQQAFGVECEELTWSLSAFR